MGNIGFTVNLFCTKLVFYLMQEYKLFVTPVCSQCKCFINYSAVGKIQHNYGENPVVCVTI